MTVVGLADGTFDVPAGVAEQVASERVSLPWAHPGWRPLLSGEAAERFKITPAPVSDPDDTGTTAGDGT